MPNMSVSQSKLGKISAVFTYIITGILIITFVFFLNETYTNTFSKHFSLGFLIYIFLFLPVIFIPYFTYRLFKKHGKAYIFFVFFIVFYVLTFIVFVKTITYRDKYRFFDPFLQMQPVLNTDLLKTKAENEVRILFLGGSTTRCALLPEEKRYTFLLRNQLQEKFPDKIITVYNAGMDWFTTRHSLITYTNYFKNYKADIVILMHAINDVYRSFTPLNIASECFMPDYSHFYGPSAHAAFPERSYPEKIMNEMMRFFNVTVMRKKDIEVDFDLSVYKSAQSYKYFYSLLIDEICCDSALPIILSEPFIYNDSLTLKEKNILWFAQNFCYNQRENNYKNYCKKIASVKSLNDAMTYYNHIAKEISINKKVPFLDIEKDIPKNTDYFIDDVHFTVKASEKMADIITDFLLEKKLMKKK